MDDVGIVALVVSGDARVGIAALVQPFDLLVRDGEHLVAVAELQGVGLAGRHACGLHPRLDAVDAAGALVDDALSGRAVVVVARHVEGARALAVLAPDALGVVDGHHARLLVLGDGAARAHRGAGRVVAMLAAAAAECPADGLGRIGRRGLSLVERNDQTGIAVDVDRVLMRARPFRFPGRRRGQVVPAFAGDLASFACGAFGGIEQDCFFCHGFLPMPSRCSRGTPCIPA